METGVGAQPWEAPLVVSERLFFGCISVVSVVGSVVVVARSGIGSGLLFLTVSSVVISLALTTWSQVRLALSRR